MSKSQQRWAFQKVQWPLPLLREVAVRLSPQGVRGRGCCNMRACAAHAWSQEVANAHCCPSRITQGSEMLLGTGFQTYHLTFVVG